MRIGDERAKEIVGSLECWRTGYMTRAERSMLKVLEGGCSVPVGVESSLVELDLPGSPPPQATYLSGAPRPHNRAEDPHAATITLHGTVTSLSGTSSVIASITRNVYSIADAETLGADIAAELIAGGGREILEELGRHVKEVHGEDGTEVPFESNGRAAVNIAPITSRARRGSMGQQLSKSPTSPHHRTVFREGEVCLRPQGW